MKYDVVKVEGGNFFALDETGEKIIASTNEEHYKQAKVPVMKKEWFGEVATAIEPNHIQFLSRYLWMELGLHIMLQNRMK